MTDIKIVYDPYAKKTSVFYYEHEIVSEDNTIVSFLKTNGFDKCLSAFKQGKYVRWQGLLPEIIKDVNDDELSIIFEGKDENFKELEVAFHDSKDTINNMGYENNWNLSFVENFSDIETVIENLKCIIEKFRDFCDTRKELDLLRDYINRLKPDTYTEIRENVMKTFEQHIEKWENSNSPYKEGKIGLMRILLNDVENLKY